MEQVLAEDAIHARVGERPQLLGGPLDGADDPTGGRIVQQRIGAEAGSLLRDPPAGWIIGTVEPAAEQLRALAVAGVDRVFCQHLLHDDLDAVALIGERLAPEVAASGRPA